ncbi:hypothetical protein [Winogradskyella sp.]|jgi:hypothetical protein|uniref:hypothetical protein n=1 Tax=Winogradskyella sp. TaxID=1883156 RepID=UPI0025E197B7|nr:hypothetical protein [Winogradskyella sp.]MCT4629103.1 hypothetical protein [Winogradskyella sp.]
MKYWKSILALVIMPFAFYYDLITFYFAVVFLIWSVQGIKNKTAIFLDHIHRDDNPILFWLISIAWLVLSIVSLAFSEPVINWYYGY